MPPPTNPPLVLDPEALLGPVGRPLHRDAQLDELRACFSGPLARVHPLHAWLHGPPGAGKTNCVRYLFEQEVQKEGVLPVYVNCRERFTFLGVVERILDALKPLRSPQRTKEVQLSILRAELADRRAVIGLDEVDTLPKEDRADLLGHLCEFPKVSVVCVGPTRLALLELPEAVSSRLAPRQILFPRYQPEEVAALLRKTLAAALRPGARQEGALEKLVEYSYGDARRALALPRHAVHRAEAAGSQLLKAEHLLSANFSHYDPQEEEKLSVLGANYRVLVEPREGTSPSDGAGARVRGSEQAEGDGARLAADAQQVPRDPV